MDDQPIWIRHAKGRILAMPYPIEVNDTRGIVCPVHRDEFADMIVDQFRRRCCAVGAQPLVCRSPCTPSSLGVRTASVGSAGPCAHSRARKRVWLTRPRDICAHVESLPPRRPGSML